MNDVHDHPEPDASGVKTEALLPNGRKVQADIMHLIPADQIRWLVMERTKHAGGEADKPFKVDLQHVACYREKERFEDEPDAEAEDA